MEVSAENLERYYKEAPGLIRSKGYTHEQLVELLAKEIRACKDLWGAYQRHQEPNRRQLAAEEIADAEAAYKGYKNDTMNAREDDIIDSIVNIKATGMVMQHVIKLGTGGRGKGRSPAGQPASRIGAIIWIVAIGAILFFIFR